MTPQVSVVIATFNRKVVLLEAIASAQRQTFRDLEILVCDDGSTDGSREAVAAMIVSDARIRWIDGEHSGLPGTTRNRGIRDARGEWIAFLDSDDLWLPGKIEMQLKQLPALPGAGFIYSHAVALQADGTRRRMTPFRVPRQGRIFDTLLLYSFIHTSTVLIRRDVLARTGAYDETMRLTIGEDYELYLRLAAQTDFLFVAQDLVLYRTQPDSISADLLDGIDQVERVLRATIERERVAAGTAARALARLDLRRYKQRLLLRSTEAARVKHLYAALEKEPGNRLASVLLLAEKLGCAGLVRFLARS